MENSLLFCKVACILRGEVWCLSHVASLIEEDVGGSGLKDGVGWMVVFVDWMDAGVGWIDVCVGWMV